MDGNNGPTITHNIRNPMNPVGRHSPDSTGAKPFAKHPHPTVDNWNAQLQGLPPGPSRYLVPIANGTHCVVSTLPIVPHRHQWPGLITSDLGWTTSTALTTLSREGVFGSHPIHPNYKSRPQKDDFFLLNISDYLDWKHLLIRGFLSCVMFVRKHCMSSIFSEAQLGYLKPFPYDMSIPKTEFQFE